MLSLCPEPDSLGEANRAAPLPVSLGVVYRLGRTGVRGGRYRKLITENKTNLAAFCVPLWNKSTSTIGENLQVKLSDRGKKKKKVS